MSRILIILLCIGSLVCAGCSSSAKWATVLSGGACYNYHYINPITQEEIDVTVVSTRETAGYGTNVTMQRDGTLSVKTGDLMAGPNNLVLIPTTLEMAAKLLSGGLIAAGK